MRVVHAVDVDTGAAVEDVAEGSLDAAAGGDCEPLLVVGGGVSAAVIVSGARLYWWRLEMAPLAQVRGSSSTNLFCVFLRARVCVYSCGCCDKWAHAGRPGSSGRPVRTRRDEESLSPRRP